MKLALVTICLLIASIASAEIRGSWTTVDDGRIFVVWFLGCNLYDDILPPEPCYRESEVFIDDERTNTEWDYDPFGHGLLIYQDAAETIIDMPFARRPIAVGRVDSTENIMVLSWGGKTYVLIR